MGHITNPVGFRVGRVNNWSSLWSVDKYAYANNWILDLSFQKYFEFLFGKLQILSYKKGFIFSHADVFLSSNSYYVIVYIYNSNLMLLHKGRFYYFWTRLLKIKSSFLYRLQKLYLKSDFEFLKKNCISFSKVCQQKVTLNRDYFLLKSVIQKKPFSIISRLLSITSQYKHGFIDKMFYRIGKSKAFLINKRYRIFKLYAKNKKKKKIIF